MTVVEGGSTALQIHVEKLEDPVSSDPKLFAPSESMRANGFRPTMVQAHFRDIATLPARYSGTAQPVIVHAMIAPDGKVEEAEALQESDAALSSAALDRVRNGSYPARFGPGESGSPREREAFLNIGFAPAQ